MKEVKILVIPCDTGIADEIIDSLKYHKYFVVIKAKHKIEKTDINKCFILPFEHEDNFYEELNKLIKKEKITFIIPANDNLAYELSKNTAKIEATLLSPNYQVHEIVRFKHKTYEFFKDIIPVPQVYEYKLIKDKKHLFPVFIKPTKGQGSQDSSIINDLSELEIFLSNKNPDEYIITEYLPFEEYTVDCFSHHGKLLYFSVRERIKTFRGTAIITTLVKDREIIEQIKPFAEKISSILKMHGIFFFQMKKDINKNLKLLEIGARVPGSLALNRALGVNLVELLIYQGLGLIDESSKIYINNIQSEITLFRSLDRKFEINLDYENVYIDFDDSLSINEKKINTGVIKFIFYAKNNNKKIYLITKHNKGYLDSFLKKFGISDVFDDIIIISDNQKKADFMKPKSMLIDDSFGERKEAIEKGLLAYSPDIVESLIKGD